MKRTLIAVALFTALSTSAMASENNWKDDTKDAWIDGKAEATLLFNTKLNSFDINTDVKQGKVTLTGKVENEIDKELAEELVRGIDGVTDVENSLTIVMGDTDDMDDMEEMDDVDHNSSTAMKNDKMGMKEGDHTTMMNSMSGMKDGDHTAMQDKMDGMTDEEHAAMQDNMHDMQDGDHTAMQEDMDDELDNMDDSEEGSVISDAKISTVVKSRLLFDSEVSGTDINVDVDNRVVTLKGTVKSEAERQLVVSIAENTDDVASVNDELMIDAEK